jgi:hypothetical protein
MRRYEILLPLAYNDGRPVEKSKFLQTCRDIVARFQAVSFDLSPRGGIWEYEGRTYEDESAKVTCDVPRGRKSRVFFVRLKETLKERFQQIEIWIVAFDIEVL